VLCYTDEINPIPSFLGSDDDDPETDDDEDNNPDPDSPPSPFSPTKNLNLPVEQPADCKQQ